MEWKDWNVYTVSSKLQIIVIKLLLAKGRSLFLLKTGFLPIVLPNLDHRDHKIVADVYDLN